MAHTTTASDAPVSATVTPVRPRASAPEATTFARPNPAWYDRYDALLIGGTAVVVVFAIWELAWQQGWISPLFFSGPSAIFNRFWQGITDGTLLRHIGYSGMNFAMGLGIAILVAIPLGILIGWYRRVRLLFDPFLNSLYATPRVALIPLIVLSLGIGNESKIFIIFLSAFFPILINTMAGVRTVDPQLLRAARAFCASDRETFVTVVLPSSVPFILAGIRQGVALGLIGMVVSELFAGNQGVGFLITYGGTTFQTDLLFVGIFIVAATGLLLTMLLERVQRRFENWRPSR